MSDGLRAEAPRWDCLTGGIVLRYSKSHCKLSVILEYCNNKEMETTNQQSQPNPILSEDQSKQHIINNQHGNFIFIVGIVILMIIVTGLGGYYLLAQRGQTSIKNQQAQPTISPISSDLIESEITNWKTYTDSKNMFTVKYPPSLYVKGAGQQIFLAKKNATDAEKLDYSDQLVEIRIDNFNKRFESYYNTQDGTIVTGYGDLKLRNYTIDGYKTVEYGYDTTDKQKELKQNEDALKSGASVGMIYFSKGVIVNKDGTVFEISTNVYTRDFKATFDKIISSLKFSSSNQLNEANLNDNNSDLIKIYNELKQQNKIKECHYYDNCYQDSLTPNVRLQVAFKYGVVNSASSDTDVRIGLLRGSSADIPGIGTGYFENKNKLNLQSDGWYWEIGACSTNNRIFVDAVTGQSGPLHKFVYCGGMP